MCKGNNQVLTVLLIILMIDSEAVFFYNEQICTQDFFVHLKVCMGFFNVAGLVNGGQDFFHSLTVYM